MVNSNSSPAFPTDEYFDGKICGQLPGMELRDYFAAKAMVAELVTSSSDATPKACDALIEAACAANRDVIDQVAHNAYQMADAMLRARAAQSPAGISYEQASGRGQRSPADTMRAHLDTFGEGKP